MLTLFIANFLLVIHLLFILFVLMGGLLVLKWPRLAWVHLPAALWGAVVEAMGWVCPLTPLENRYRVLAGQEGYSEDFVAHYLLPLIYPADLGGDLQVALAGLVVMINTVIYLFIFSQAR